MPWSQYVAAYTVYLCSTSSCGFVLLECLQRAGHIYTFPFKDPGVRWQELWYLSIIFLCLGPKTLIPSLMGSACKPGLEPEVISVEWCRTGYWKRSVRRDVLTSSLLMGKDGFKICGAMNENSIMCHQMWYGQILSLARDGVALWSKSNDSCHHVIRLEAYTDHHW